MNVWNKKSNNSWFDSSFLFQLCKRQQYYLTSYHLFSSHSYDTNPSLLLLFFHSFLVIYLFLLYTYNISSNTFIVCLFFQAYHCSSFLTLSNGAPHTISPSNTNIYILVFPFWHFNMHFFSHFPYLFCFLICFQFTQSYFFLALSLALKRKHSMTLTNIKHSILLLNPLPLLALNIKRSHLLLNPLLFLALVSLYQSFLCCIPSRFHFSFSPVRSGIIFFNHFLVFFFLVLHNREVWVRVICFLKTTTTKVRTHIKYMRERRKGIKIYVNIYIEIHLLAVISKQKKIMTSERAGIVR